MKKLALILLVMFAIAQFAHAKDSDWQLIQRPWDNFGGWVKSNPNVVVTDNGSDYWYSSVMGKSLEGLNLEDALADDLDADVRTKAQKAFQDKNSAEIKAMQCDRVVGILATSIMIVGSASGPVTYFAALIIAGEKNKTLSPYVKACDDYDVPWRSSMNLAMDALQESGEIEQQEYEKAQSSYAIMEYSGICDEDYIWPEKAKCKQAQNYMSSRDGKREPLVYDIGIFGDYLRQYEPDSGEYNTYMAQFWEKDNGIIALDRKITNESTDALILAGRNYDLLKAQTDYNEKAADSAAAGLKKEELGLIGEAAAGSKGTAGTIAGRYAALAESVEDAKKAKETAQNSWSFRISGYVKNATLNMINANGAFAKAINDAPKLRQDAEVIVDKMKAEASQELEKLNAAAKEKIVSAEIQIRIDNAKEDFNSAELPGIVLGKRYAFYYSAASKARTAQGWVGSYQPLADVQYKAELARVKLLLDGAQADSVEVGEEKAFYDEITLLGKPALLQTLKGLESQIVAKAKLKYYYLESRRQSIRARMSLLPEMNSMLRNLDEFEKSFVSSGKIDYALALGKLAQIDSKYAMFEETLEGKEKAIVANSMETRVGYFTGEVIPGKQSHVTLTLSIKNTKSYEAENVQIEVTLPSEIIFSKSDLVLGRENAAEVKQNGRKLAITLTKVGALESYWVEFGKEEVIAEIISSQSSAQGRSDGSASISEKIVIDLKTDSSISVAGYENPKIDGRPYNGAAIGKGRHTLENSYENEDAYSVRTENYRMGILGINTDVSYDIVFVPKIGLDSISFLISGKRDELIKNFNVVSVSGEKISNKNFLDNGEYSFDILGLKAGREAKARVSYIVQNSQEYIEQKLSALEKITTTESVKEIIREARDRLQNNDTKTAMEKITQAENEIARINMEKAKYGKTYLKLAKGIEGKIASLEIAITAGDGISDTFMGALATRKQELEGKLKDAQELAEEESFQDAMEELEGVDAGWESKQTVQKRKDMFSEYNAVKQKMLKIAAELPFEFQDFEGKLKKADISGRVEDAVDALVSLEGVKKAFSLGEVVSAREFAALSEKFTLLKKSIAKKLDEYNSQAKAAKGSKYEFLFSLDTKATDSLLKAAEKLLSDKAANDKIAGKISELEYEDAKLEDASATIEKYASDKAQNAESYFIANKDAISDGEKEKIASLIASMKGALAAGDNVNALKLSGEAVDAVGKATGKDNKMLILLTAVTVVVLGVIVMYMAKQGGASGLGGIKLPSNWPGFKSNENAKQYRKLKKAEE